MKNISLKSISPKETEFTVIDFETTGLSPKSAKVIEVGLVKVKNLKVADTFSVLINPAQHIPSEITMLTGITNSDVENAPAFEEVAPKISEFIGDSVLVGHNLKFDYSFLESEFRNAELSPPEVHQLCTLKLSRKLLPHLPNKSLGTVKKHLRIRHKNMHRALSDAMVTAKVLIKLIKKLETEFEVKTTSDILSFQSLPKTNKTFRIIKKKLSEDYARLPENPGVYFFQNAKGKIFYIGKAKSLKKRVQNYFSTTAPRKAKKIVRQSSRLGFQTTKSELTALLAEAELIKKHNPPLNTLLKKYSRSYFIKVTRNDKFPVVEISSSFNFDGNDYFGPYSNRNIANDMKEIIDKTFQLRECNDKEFSKSKKCYLADIERCLAPCVLPAIENEYDAELEKVFEYLSGQNQFAVNRLLKKMKSLSDKKRYEEAAVVRDSIENILNHLNRSSILAEPVNRAKVLIEIKDSRETDYLLMLEGKIIIKDYIVSNKTDFDSVLEEYFSGTINLFPDLTEEDLEKMKISLSWLVRNRHKIKIHYLKNFQSKEELMKSLVF